MNKYYYTFGLFFCFILAGCSQKVTGSFSNGEASTVSTSNAGQNPPVTPSGTPTISVEKPVSATPPNPTRFKE